MLQIPSRDQKCQGPKRSYTTTYWVSPKTFWTDNTMDRHMKMSILVWLCENSKNRHRSTFCTYRNIPLVWLPTQVEKATQGLFVPKNATQEACVKTARQTARHADRQTDRKTW